MEQVSNRQDPSADPARWTWRTLLTAAGLTLLLFGLLPLAHLFNQPDKDALIALRDVDAVEWPPPPPVPLAEPEPVTERPPEPIRLDLPEPAAPTAEQPPLATPWEVRFPAWNGAAGVALDPAAWTIRGGVYTLADIDTAPRPLVQPAPSYPPLARQRGLEGTVELAFVVTATGRVTDVQVVDAQPGTVFVAAARSAVEQWRFEPAQRGGEAVAVRVRIPLQFRLDER